MTTPEKDNVTGAAANDTGAEATSSAPSPDEQVSAAEVIDPEEIDPELVAEVEAAVADVATEAAADAEPTDAEQVAAAQAEAAEWQDKYMRLHAEWDTYRRRMGEQREAEKARATEKLMESLLPVLDDFVRTVDYAEQNGETGLLGGVKAVQAKLSDTLAKGGLEAIDPAGEPFDALQHQAVATVDDASVPDETVAQVYQLGYRMGDKVLRPAMVTITTGGPKREKPEEE